MGLLLDRLTVYGEMLDVAVELLRRNHTTSVAELRPRLFPFGASEGVEHELLSYLQDLGIAQMTETDPQVVALATTFAANTEVRLHILAALRRFRDENAVIFDLYQFLIEDDTLTRRVLERDHIWPRYNQYRERSGGLIVALNSPKMASWLRLMSYLGIIRPERSNAFVLAPALELVRELIRHAAQSRLNLALPSLIAMIEATFCPMTLRPGRLHPGFADAVELLERRGEIALTFHGDAEALAVNDRQVSHVILQPRHPVHASPAGAV